MIEIDRLRMRLPPGFEHRAASISRLVGQALAARHLSAGQALDRLSLPSVKIRIESSDSEIAGLIVQQIVSAVGGRELQT